MWKFGGANRTLVFPSLYLRGGGGVERRKGYKNKFMVNILVVCVIRKKIILFNSQAQTSLIHFDAWKTEV